MVRYMTEYTTVQVRPETKETLASLKETSKESYDDVIKQMLKLIPEGDEEGEYTDEFRIGLLKARLDIKKGNLTSHSKVKKRIGEPNQ